MTPEQIDALTLGEVRAICERAAETLTKARDVLSLFGGPIRAPINSALNPGISPGHIYGRPSPEPFPCPACGRLAPERPGEAVKDSECNLCGNHLPGGDGPLSNKGPILLTAEERARRATLPAFDKNGDPT